MQGLFVIKKHFLEFIYVGYKVRLDQLNINAANLSTNLSQSFYACPWAR